jgi:hypothetical protein
VGRLSARHVALEDDRGEAVRRCVHGRGQAGRTGADDGQVVARALGRIEVVPDPGQTLHRHPGVHVIPVDDDRQGRINETEAAHEAVGLGRASLEPFVRLRDSGEEVAQAMMLRIEPFADDPDCRTNGAHRVILRSIDALGAFGAVRARVALRSRG